MRVVNRTSPWLAMGGLLAGLFPFLRVHAQQDGGGGPDADLCVDAQLCKSTITPGEQPRLVFAQALAMRQGEQGWVAVVPAGSADGEWGSWAYVENGATDATPPAVSEAGQYEVRLHMRYPTENFHVVCRFPLEVTPDADLAVGFLLESTALPAGGTPRVTFQGSVAPREGEQYWITVAPAGSADSEWGTWQYVEAGATQIELAPVAQPGEYEVRLHARYSTDGNHPIHRARLKVM